jgi:hypothetical protein
VKTVGISGKTKFMSLQETVRTRILENCTHRGIIDFKRGHQPRSNIVKDEKGDVLADSHILNSSQLLNVYRVTDVRQIEIHTAELLGPDPSPFEVEIATAKLRRFKSPGSDQIPAELIQAGGEILRSKIHKLIKIWNKEKVPDQWKESVL